MNGPRIVIAGAGSVGCFVGGLLAAAGRDVAFLARDRIAAELREHGLTLTDYGKLSVNLPPDRLDLATDTVVLAAADIVLATVKSGATEEMGSIIAAYAPAAAVVVSLQNGVGNADRLRSLLPGYTVLAGMVPFNVLHRGDGRFHRGTSGDLVIEAGEPQAVEALTVAHLGVRAVTDMPAILWGKLLINLNNALNALAGVPLREELMSRAWRRLFADQVDEALGVLSAAGITPKSAGPLPPERLPGLLRLPTFLFRLVARQSVRIDPLARSSMWEDLERRRPTEIDEIQGAVVTLAERIGRPAPLNARVRQLIRQAETANAGSPQLRAEDVRG